MWPPALFCRASVCTTAGLERSRSSTLAMPLSEPQPPAAGSVFSGSGWAGAAAVVEVVEVVEVMEVREVWGYNVSLSEEAPRAAKG